jgi:hypothetical protein
MRNYSTKEGAGCSPLVGKLKEKCKGVRRAPHAPGTRRHHRARGRHLPEPDGL